MADKPVPAASERMTAKDLSATLDRWETQAERGWLDKDELKSLRGHVLSLERELAEAKAGAIPNGPSVLIARERYDQLRTLAARAETARSIVADLLAHPGIADMDPDDKDSDDHAIERRARQFLTAPPPT